MINKIKKKLLDYSFYKNKKNNQIQKFQFNIYKKYLIVAPHPDDELLYCSGILFSSKKNVTVLCLTNGNDKIRLNEFKKVMSKFNLRNFKILDSNEGNLIPDKIEINLKEYDFILTPNVVNNHIDHFKIHYYLKKNLKRFKNDARIILYEDNGTLQFPSHYFDISKYYKDKFEIFKLYQSQMSSKYDFLKNISALNKYRGSLVSKNYAEFFTVLSIKQYQELIKINL